MKKVLQFFCLFLFLGTAAYAQLPEVDFVGPNLQVDETSGTTTVVVGLDIPTTTHDTIVISFFPFGNTAINLTDYSTNPAFTNGEFELTFAPGDTAATFDVTIIDDLIFEGNENIRLTIAAATAGITIATGGGGGPGGGGANFSITILDNEILPIIDFQNDFSVDEAVGGTYTITLTLDIPAITHDTLIVDIPGTGNTATEGLDYSTTPNFVNGQLQFTFAPGDTAVSFDLTIIDDLIFEGDEDIRFRVAATTSGISVPIGGGGPGGGGGGADLYVTILDNEIVPVVDFQDNVTVDEASGTHTISLLLDIPAITNDTLTIDFPPGGNTATDGLDYTTTPNTVNGVFDLTIAPGDTVITFDLAIIDDTVIEGNENIRFRVAATTGGITIPTGGGGPGGGGAALTVTITDNETAPTVSFATNIITEVENTGTHTVSLDLDIPAIGYDTIVIGLAGPQSATNNADYTTTPAMVNDEITLYLAPGDATASFDVTIIDDVDVEGTETARFRILSASDSLLVGNPQGVRFNIIDDEGAPTLFYNIVNTTQDEGSGTHTVEMAFTKAINFTDTLVVQLTGNSTATYGLDFTTMPAMINDDFFIPLAIGDSVLSFDIMIIDDTDQEGNEVARFRMIGTNNFDVAIPPVHSIIISDNDATNTSILDKIDFNVYPNPANNQLTIEVEMGEYQLELRNITGKLIHQQVLRQKGQLDVSHLPQGMYLLSVYTENGIGTKKVIIAR